MRCQCVFAVIALFILSGCKTADKAFSTTERLLRSSTGRIVVNLAQVLCHFGLQYRPTQCVQGVFFRLSSRS